MCQSCRVVSQTGFNILKLKIMASKVGLGAKSGLGRTTAGAKSSGSKLQVFLNGKIVTPQSLLYASRKAANKGGFDGGHVTDSGIADKTDIKKTPLNDGYLESWKYLEM